MTAADAIRKIDELAPNQYSAEQKLDWLTEIEGRIQIEIYDTHEGSPTSEIGETMTAETLLTVPAPYSVLYVDFLRTQIDYCNGENIRQQDSADKFNDSFESFAAYWNRTHKPIRTGRFRY